MKKHLIIRLITIFSAIMNMRMVLASHNNTMGDLSGIWVGRFHGMSEKTFYLRIYKDKDGNWMTKFGQPEQGSADISVKKYQYNNGIFFCDVANIGSFEGRLNSKGDLVGKFILYGVKTQAIPIILEAADTIPKITRPQNPKPPFPYQEEQVSYENKMSGVILEGTLSIPKGKAPFPAAILITGSGAHDRNETVFGHYPFWVLADYLVRRGIAVLRVDDRGVGGSTGSVDLSTSLDFCGDVLTGVDFLKTRKEINSKQIGLIGHSEGGIIAPMAATANGKDIAYIVLMAAPGQPLDELLLLQGRLCGNGLATLSPTIFQRSACLNSTGLLEPVKKSL